MISDDLTLAAMIQVEEAVEKMLGLLNPENFETHLLKMRPSELINKIYEQSSIIRDLLIETEEGTHNGILNSAAQGCNLTDLMFVAYWGKIHYSVESPAHINYLKVIYKDTTFVCLISKNEGL